MSNERVSRAPAPNLPELAFQHGQPLPIFARREGAGVVIIRIEEYRELLGLRTRSTRGAFAAAAHARKAPPPGLSTIEKDPEVADFLRSLFRGRMTLHALRAACVNRFGEVRAPSTGRIQVYRARFWSY